MVIQVSHQSYVFGKVKVNNYYYNLWTAMHIYHMINSFGNNQKGTLDTPLFDGPDHAFLTVDDRETHIAKQLFDQFGGNLFLLDDTQPIFFTGTDTIQRLYAIAVQM